MFDRDYLEEVRALEVLDFSISIGRPAVPPSGFFAQKEDALAEMNRLAIAQALVYHVTAKGYQAVYGNGRLIEEISDAPQMIASWVLVPSQGEMGCSPVQFVEELKKNSVKAVRMFPSSQSAAASATRFAFCKWFYGEFMDALSQAQIPVALEFTPHRRAEPEWEKLHDLATEFPKLPIVLCDGFQRATWSLVELMKICPNLYVQTSGLDVHRQLEYMIGKVGPERFLAGSKYPDMHMGTMLGQLLFSNLTFEHAKLIAGDNARRIMGILR